MSYIYELHVALLRINYLCRNGAVCFDVATEMTNYEPYDFSNIEMEYRASILTPEKQEETGKIELKCTMTFHAENLQELVEKARKFFVLQPADNKQLLVDNFQADTVTSSKPVL